MTKLPNQIDNIEFPFQDREALIESRKFYQQVFGWQYQEWGPEYLDTSDSGVASGLTVDKRQYPLVIIYTDNIEQALATVKQAGGRLLGNCFIFLVGVVFNLKTLLAMNWPFGLNSIT